jgi:hypothetical protein
MKKSAICIAVLAATLLVGCNGDEKKAQARLDAAKSLFEQGEYSAAKTEIDSMRVLYPKEFDIQKAGLALMRQVEQKEAERNIAFCDSLIPIRHAGFMEMAKGFVYEKDTAYDEIGKFVSKLMTIERNVKRCYVRSGVDENGEMYIASVFFGPKPIKHTGIKLSTPDGITAETPAIPYDGGMNYRFEDLGNTSEVVTYKGEKCTDAAKFIYDNKDARIKIEYTGGKPYVLYLNDVEKKAIASTYELAVILSDIDKMNKEKEKSIKRIAYLAGKLKKSEDKQE